MQSPQKMAGAKRHSGDVEVEVFAADAEVVTERTGGPTGRLPAHRGEVMSATTVDVVQSADRHQATTRRPGRSGGVAALVQAATFVFGFAVYGTVVADADYGNAAVDPSSHVAFLTENLTVIHAWYAVIYLVFGAALVVLAPALHDRIRSSAPTLARTGTAFGLIWAVLMFAVGMTAIVGIDLVVTLVDDDPGRAASLYDTVALLIEGMGGGIELVGGLWIGLVSLAAQRARVLSPWLNRVGMVTGVAGVATTTLLAPEVVTSVFGAGCIVWFTWLGVHLLRSRRAGIASGR